MVSMEFYVNRLGVKLCLMFAVVIGARGVECL